MADDPLAKLRAMAGGTQQQTAQAPQKPPTQTQDPLAKLRTMAGGGQPTAAPRQQELAYGAQGKMATGEDYYGRGLAGWWQGVKSRIQQPYYEKQADGTYKPVQTNKAQLAGRVIKEGIMALGTGLSQPAEWAQGLLFGLPQGLEDWADRVNSPLPDIAQRDVWQTKLFSTVPMLGMPASMIYNVARIATGTRSLQSDEALNLIKANYEFGARAMASGILAETELTDRQRAWLKETKVDDQGNTVYKHNVLGLANLEPGLRAEFVRRYMTGEDPQLIAAELANPWAEMATDLLVDPMNIVGDFMADAAKAKRLLNAQKRVAEVAPEAAKAFDALQVARQSGNVAEAERLTVEFAGQMAELAKSKAVGMTDINKITSASKWQEATSLTEKFEAAGKIASEVLEKSPLTRLTSSGRQLMASENVGDFFTMASSVFRQRPDELGAFLHASALLGSGDADDVRKAMDIMGNLSADMSKIAMSESGLEAGVIMRKMFSDADGALSLRAMDDFFALAKEGDQVKLMEAYGRKMKDTLDEMYPSLVDIAKRQESARKKIEAGEALTKAEAAAQKMDIPAWQMNIAKTHDFLQHRMIGGKAGMANMHSMFSTVYISWNPGAAVRNMIGNVTHMAVDQGIGSLKFIDLKPVVSGSAVDKNFAFLEDMIGAKYFDVDSKKAAGILEGGKDVAGMFQKTEESVHNAILASSVYDTMKRGLKEGAGIVERKALLEAGMEKGTIDRLMQLTKEAHGDVDKAITKFRLEMDSGIVDVWRTPEAILSKNDLQHMEPGVRAGIENALQRGNEDEILAALDNIVAEKKRIMAKSSKDAPPLPASNDDFTHADFMNLPEEDAQLWGIRYTAHSNADEAAMEALRDLQNRAGMIVNSPEYQQSMRAIKQAEQQAGLSKIKVREITNAIRDRLNHGAPLSEVWDDMTTKLPGWKEAGVQKPPILTKENVRQALWEGYYYPVTEAGFTQLREEKLAVIKQMAQQSGLGDTPLLQQAMKDHQYSMDLSKAIFTKKEGLRFQNVRDALILNDTPSNAIRALAQKAGISTAWEKGSKQMATSDKTLLDIINKYAPAPNVADNAVSGISDIENRATQIRSTLSRVGISPELKAEFPDLPPGVVRQGGKNIDDLAVNLVEDGLLSQDEVGDYAKVTEMIKKTYATAPLRDSGAAVRTVQGTDTLAKVAGGLADQAYQSGQKLFSKLDDVDWETAQAALKNYISSKGGDAERFFAGLDNSPIPMPYLKGSMPTSARAALESFNGTRDVVERAKAGVKAAFGQGQAAKALDAKQEAALFEWMRQQRGRKAELNMKALTKARADAEFSLLAYGKKRTFDVALAYIFPYQFWYNRTYANWIKRMATNPQVIAAYAKYRKTLEAAHGNSPDWWKYNVSTQDFGIDTEHPFFFNLEATLNPLNGLTGVDFDDPDRIVGDKGTFENNLTTTLNNLGKFGPSLYTPISMATAYYLYLKGNREAASRWGGRLIPQTATVKAISAALGFNPLELDPMVNLMSDGRGTDPYEERRIGRALAAMVEEKIITQAQAVDAAYAKEGDIWDKAYQRAVSERAASQIGSQFAGVGFKARTPQDMAIDQFYTDYRQLWAANDNLSPEEFRIAMDSLRKQYPFMDTVLLSKREGLDRDRGYAYTIMSRIPPGKTSDVSKSVGLDPALLQKFYDTKGHIEAWPETDRMKFMAGMKDLAAILDSPPDATQMEWTAARNTYGRMNDTIKQQFGADIFSKIDRMYEFGTPDEKNAYLAQFPEVQAALDFKANAVVSSPLLSAYYNGMGQMENYYNGNKRRDIQDKLGKDIWVIMDQYNYLNTFGTPAEVKAYKRRFPQIKQYYDLNDKWNMKIDQELAKFGGKLPKGIPAQLRPETMETVGQEEVNRRLSEMGSGERARLEARAKEQGITLQELMYGQLAQSSQGAQSLMAAQTQQGPQWNDVAGSVPMPLQQALASYYQQSRPLSYSEQSRLKRVAKVLGLQYNDLISLAGQAYGR